ncbi:uncharacterized protein [Primulina huaijiensis]|uniref:uncharacterized protein isoform X2 n=1 Tax=Primulina huaijiensis TaxID=1492673 RepID=UPI003CC764E8
MGRAKTQSFKGQFSLEERMLESQDIIAKYPDRLPVVVERYEKTDLPEMEKKKLICCVMLVLVCSDTLTLTLAEYFCTPFISKGVVKNFASLISGSSLHPC